MSFASYAALQTAIADWMNRGDLTAVIPDLIIAAEATMNKVLRTRLMMTSSTVTVVTGTDRIALPATLLDILYIANNSTPSETLTKQPAAWIAEQQRLRLSTPGTPLYYNILGSDMLVCPVPSANKTYKLTYYQEIPALSVSNTSNWVLQHHPDLYLYISLMFAESYMSDEQRAALYDQSVTKMVQSLISNNATTTLEGQGYDVFKG